MEASPVQPKTVSHVLGEIAWLMSQSAIHRQLFISDLEWFAMPAVLLEQFRTYPGPNGPAAVVFWASVSDEVDARLEREGGRLRPDEWKGGENLWIIEVVSPFGGGEEIVADLQQNVFQGRRFKFHETNAQGRSVRTVEPAAGGPH